MSKTYHKLLGFPPDIQPMTGKIDLSITDHARRQAETERPYAPFEIPSSVEITREMYERDPIETRKPHVFEIEVSPTGRVVKVALREKYNEVEDRTVVIDEWDNLTTAWLDPKNERFENVDESAYTTP